ncbi:MAG: alpha/beta fold hydrolase [SAR202 cluster bacterium]|nr:alpha/beta fold hydrolase [SAR202 cluster bacterium]
MSTATLTEPGTSKFAQAGKIKVHYNEAGTGHPVILLHGGGAGASGWSNFVRNIGPLSEKYRVLLVDQPNYGKTDLVPLTEPLGQVSARMVRDLMDTLGMQKATLVGNSLGGMTTLNFAVDYPDRLERMVLMGTPGPAVDLFTTFPTEGQKLLFRLFDTATLEAFRAFINIMCYDASFATDELLQQRVKAATARPEAAQILKAGLMRSRDLVPALRNTKHKSLIIHGRYDRVVPMEGSMQLFSLLENSTLLFFNKCGHWAQFEKADEFNRALVDFIDHS